MFNKLVYKNSRWEAESDDGRVFIVDNKTWEQEFHRRTISFLQASTTGIEQARAAAMLKNRIEYPEAEQAFDYVQDLLKDPHWWFADYRYSQHLGEPEAAVRIVPKKEQGIFNCLQCGYPYAERVTCHCEE